MSFPKEQKKCTNLCDRLVKKTTHFFYTKFIKSHRENADRNRREFILNVVLLCVILISSLFTAMVCFDRFFIETTKTSKGMGVWPMFLIFLTFVSLHLLVRKGFFKFATVVVLSLVYLMTTYTMYHWGFDTPQVWISYALVIVMANVLTEFRVAIIILVIIFLTIFTITNFQLNGVMEPLRYWKAIEPTSVDAFQLGITLGMVAILAWLSNYEITKSLKRARASEQKLKQERDLLETKVKERTKELQQMQIEKMSQLYRFAEFGKLSSGLFHDITNHLTALFLNLENLQDLNEKKRVRTIKNDLKGVFNTKEKLEDFLNVMWKQLQVRDAEKKERFLLEEEVQKVMEVMQYNACKNKVTLVFKKTESIEVFNSPIKLSQVITNLILNAIEAYPRVDKISSIDKKKREVEIVLKKESDRAVISVRDWGDGISSDSINSIFNPFFSTKESSTRMGAGIGLFSVKEAVENSFNGTIAVESSSQGGTKFTVTFKV